MTTKKILVFHVLIICQLLQLPLLWAGNIAERHSVVLKWQDTPDPTNEKSSFVPSLFFTGAVYSDSLPRIPVFIKRIPNNIPHFARKFTVTDKTIIPCTYREAKILEETGFDLQDFKIFEDIEFSKGQTYSRFHLIPVRKHNGKFEKLESFTFITENVYFPGLKIDPVHRHYPESSIFAAGEWYKVCVTDDGVYRITANDLARLGIDIAKVEKSMVQLFGNGGGMLPESNAEFRFTDPQENPIWVSGLNSGMFTSSDYILFYGQSPVRWQYSINENVFTHQPHLYTDQTCYFLTFGQETGLRIGSRAAVLQTPTHHINSFLYYSLHEKNTINLLGSGKMWFGESFDTRTRHQFTFPVGSAAPHRPANIRVVASSRSPLASSFTIQALNQSHTLSIGSINPNDFAGTYARTGQAVITGLPANNSIDVSISYNSSATGARGWLDYIAVNAWRNLEMTGNQLMFRDPSSTGIGNIGRFNISNANADLRVWDITNPQDIAEIPVEKSGTLASFTSQLNVLREFVAFKKGSYFAPILRGKVPNQNLHSLTAHDLIIVAPDIFLDQAELLANFRRTHDNLSVLVVTPQQIYNEFSSGTPDISAIRNFMKMLYDRAIYTNEYPRYLLLFGNGTYDNKNILGYGGNFIPTFQSMQSLNHSSSFLTDDFFGLLDDNEGFDARGSLDIGIGRFPVRTIEEANFVVDKVLRYNKRIQGLEPSSTDARLAGKISNFASWRNVIGLIADDEDGGIHLNQTELIAQYIHDQHPVFNVDKIYLDAYQQATMAGGSRYPDVNRAINNRVNQGALLINYIGHGGIQGLGHERIVTFNDIRIWNNYYNLPVIMTATCEFSRFDQPNPNERSAGVEVFLRPNGGAVALFTTTRLAFSHTNFTLNDNFIRHAFVEMENGEMPRLGDLIRESKVSSFSNPNLKNFVLLGDPSMRMAYPKYRAITTKAPDTVRALERVSVEGVIINPDGSQNHTYNGILFTTVFDKKETFVTLGNDPGSPRREFEIQNRILFQGKTSIESGRFSFSFIVPRDINYSYGLGKISYYFDDGSGYDGNGYFQDFVIAGTADEFIADNTGPEIKLFINDTTFVSGNKTGPDPILIAHLFDENGINTTGHIGHDILATIQGNTSSQVTLNNFYQASLNSYQRGRVIYPLFGLEKGNYSLSLRAWDTHNNPSTATIDFIVSPSKEITINDLINYPNPFNDKTTFLLKHNKFAEELNVQISIFSINGQLVRTINNTIFSNGFEVPIDWDGTDESGRLLQNGVYIFRVKITAKNGQYDVKSDRLVILR